jgi:MYXO-CTERM domain-containing protein
VRPRFAHEDGPDGPWGLGAVFGVGMAWFVSRRRVGRSSVVGHPPLG